MEYFLSGLADQKSQDKQYGSYPETYFCHIMSPGNLGKVIDGPKCIYQKPESINNSDKNRHQLTFNIEKYRYGQSQRNKKGNPKRCACSVRCDLARSFSIVDCRSASYIRSHFAGASFGISIKKLWIHVVSLGIRARSLLRRFL